MAFHPRNHWGNFLWGFLHTITIIDIDEPALQEHDTKRMIRHMLAIARVIPCLTCAAHYEKFVKSIENDVQLDKMWLFDRTVEFHNEVNRNTGKREWTIEEAREHWAQKLGQCQFHNCGKLIIL